MRESLVWIALLFLYKLLIYKQLIKTVDEQVKNYVLSSIHVNHEQLNPTINFL